jgi:hypothetical protein
MPPRRDDQSDEADAAADRHHRAGQQRRDRGGKQAQPLHINSQTSTCRVSGQTGASWRLALAGAKPCHSQGKMTPSFVFITVRGCIS